MAFMRIAEAVRALNLALRADGIEEFEIVLKKPDDGYRLIELVAKDIVMVAMGYGMIDRPNGHSIEQVQANSATIFGVPVKWPPKTGTQAAIDYGFPA